MFLGLWNTVLIVKYRPYCEIPSFFTTESFRRLTFKSLNLRLLMSYIYIYIYIYIYDISSLRVNEQAKFNSNKSPTRCNNFPVYYPEVYLQLNIFRAFSRLSSRTQWLQLQPLVLPSYCGDSRAVFVIGPVITDHFIHSHGDTLFAHFFLCFADRAF
jgi:hypothetical protein